MTPYIGQITLFAWTFAPHDWLPCDGQLLPIQQNLALFSLLGTRFGGDGKTNFALPDYRATTPAGSILCICVRGVFPSGASVAEVATPA